MVKMGMRICQMYFTILICIIPFCIHGQDSGNSNVLRPDVIKSGTFYLDKSQDCNGNVFEVTEQVIITAPSTSVGINVPLTCTISLHSATLKSSIFQITVQTVKVDCQMNFYIFDGSETNAILKSYSCLDSVRSPVQLVTTSDTVSFRLTRQSALSSGQIRIIIETVDDPLSGGGGGIIHKTLDPDMSYNQKFSTNIIMILMSVAYIIAILICIIILIVRYVRSSRDEKKWSARPLAYNNYGLTPASSENMSTMNAYSTNSYPDYKSKNRSFKTRIANSTEDTDSVFDEMRLNMKSQLKYSSQSSSYNNPSFQRTPTSTKRMSGRRRGSTANPPSNTHRRNQENKVKRMQEQPREVPRSSATQEVPRSSVSQEVQTEEDNRVELATVGLNTDPEMTDHGIQCEVDTSDDIANSEEINAISKQAFEYLKQHKNLHSPSLLPHGLASDDEIDRKSESNRRYYHSKYIRDSPDTYHRDQYGSPEPHIFYTDPALRHTNITPPSYMASVNGAQKPSRPMAMTDIDNRYIPVYSYLVNRGYKMDDRDKNGSGSSATGTSHHSDMRMVHTDDSDFSANLDSGVELMRR
ncbi:uncharacterized protein LOC115211971 [Argonauta hians]